MVIFRIMETNTELVASSAGRQTAVRAVVLAAAVLAAAASPPPDIAATVGIAADRRRPAQMPPPPPPTVVIAARAGGGSHTDTGARPCHDRGMTAILRYTAFTDDPAGGNPAGVVLDASGLATRGCRRSRRSSATPRPRSRRARGRRLRRPLLQPRGRSAVLRARDDRDRRRARRARRRRAGAASTPAGEVPVDTSGAGGAVTATLTSVVPRVEDVPRDVLDAALHALRWSDGRPRPGTPAADRLRRRPPPDPRRRHPRAPAPTSTTTSTR